MEVDKPRTLAFLPFMDVTGERLSIVHVFEDAAAFDAHLAGADDRSTAAYAFIAPLAFEVYGPATEAAMTMLRAGAAARAIELTVAPDLPAGFLRAGSA